jgi:hypothetical protein
LQTKTIMVRKQSNTIFFHQFYKTTNHTNTATMIDPNSDHKTYMARFKAAAHLLKTGNKEQCIEECQNTLRYDIAAIHWLECN